MGISGVADMILHTYTMVFVRNGVFSRALLACADASPGARTGMVGGLGGKGYLNRQRCFFLVVVCVGRTD